MSGGRSFTEFSSARLARRGALARECAQRAKELIMRCAGCGVELVGYSACLGCGTPAPAAAALADNGPKLPSEPWTLTAPESYALRYGITGQSTRLGAFKVALTELIARRALILQAAYIRRFLAPGARGAWLLSDGPRIAAISQPALTPVLDAYRSARRGRPRRALTRAGEPVQGVLIADLMRSATNRRGGLRGYVRRDLADQLRRRGLINGDGTLTAAGRHADRELERWIEFGRVRFANRAARDETWARRYLAGAGAAVLLVTDSNPAVARLAASTTAGPTADQAYGAAVGPQDDQAVGALDLPGALDLSALGGGALSGVDVSSAAIDATFASFDMGGGGGGG
jgi:hypothetical protein